MEDCNGLPTPTKVEAPLLTDVNSSEAKRDWPNSYASVIGMMLYLASNTRPYISFAIHQCARFTHDTKVSHKTAVKDISGLLFDAKYNIIPITEAYELVQYLLSSEPFTSVPRYASTLVGVGNPLQCSIPVDYKTLWMNPVLQN